MMRCQKKQKDILLARIKKEYPNIVEKNRCEDPNAVHRWCWFKDVVLGEGNYYRNHFSLNTDIRDEFEGLFGVDMS